MTSKKKKNIKSGIWSRIKEHPIVTSIIAMVLFIWAIIEIINSLDGFYEVFKKYSEEPKFEKPRIEIVNNDPDFSSPMSTPFKIINSDKNFKMLDVLWACNIKNTKMNTSEIDNVSVVPPPPPPIDIEPGDNHDFRCRIISAFGDNYQLSSSSCLVIGISFRISNSNPNEIHKDKAEFRWNDEAKNWIDKCEVIE
jgi:hypothetical protein